MSLCLARVDDRLIHGQIIHGWVPKLHVEVLVVADDALANHEDEQLIARMAVPESVEIRFVRPRDVQTTVSASADKNVIVLFRTPVEAQAAIRHGFTPQSLNLGNCHFEPGKMQLRKTFCCSNLELSALRDISAKGIEIAYQPAPDLKRVTVDLALV
jgi:PTS system mannose-specific IIB component